MKRLRRWHAAILVLALLGTLTTPGVDASGRTATGPASVQTASWYVDARKAGYYAAMHAYRWGMAPWRARVCRADRPTTCVTVRVSDHCQCLWGTRRQRGIDLSRTAFARLAPPSRGLVKVTIRRLP